MAMTYHLKRVPVMAMAMLLSLGGRHMKFQIGDAVEVGARIGTILDVGTVLIQFKTNDGCLRVACPWEVVKIPSLPQRVNLHR
jgi:hypothetical protein